MNNKLKSLRPWCQCQRLLIVCLGSVGYPRPWGLSQQRLRILAAVQPTLLINAISAAFLWTIFCIFCTRIYWTIFFGIAGFRGVLNHFHGYQIVPRHHVLHGKKCEWKCSMFESSHPRVFLYFHFFPFVLCWTSLNPLAISLQIDFFCSTFSTLSIISQHFLSFQNIIVHMWNSIKTCQC